MTATIGNYRVTGLYLANAITATTGPALLKTALPFVNKITFKNDVTNLQWDGDSQKVKLQVLNMIDITVACDYLDLAALLVVYGWTNVTASVPVDEAVRVYFGSNLDKTGVVAGLELYCNAVRLDTSANKKVKVTIPQAQWSPPDLADFVTSGKTGSTIAVSSLQVSTDMIGGALPSVPSGGAHAYLSEEV